MQSVSNAASGSPAAPSPARTARPRSADGRWRVALAETRPEDCRREKAGVRPEWKTDIQSPRIPYYKHNATFSSLQTPGSAQRSASAPGALVPNAARRVSKAQWGFSPIGWDRNWWNKARQ